MYSKSTADTSLLGFNITKEEVEEEEEKKEENFESYYFCDFVNHPIIQTELVGYSIDAYIDTTSKHTEEISLDHKYPMFYIGSTGISIENILLASSDNPDRKIWVIITLELNIYIYIYIYINIHSNEQYFLTVFLICKNTTPEDATLVTYLPCEISYHGSTTTTTTTTTTTKAAATTKTEALIHSLEASYGVDSSERGECTLSLYTCLNHLLYNVHKI